MITVRQLNKPEIPEAMELKIESWSEELAGKARNTMVLEEEINFWMDWTDRAEGCGDIRLLIGAFENDELLGIAAGGLAKYEDVKENGIELKLLGVKKKYRGRKISYHLILYILNYYISLGAEQIIIYSHHNAPSNTFYQRLGIHILRKEDQSYGALEVDVFMESTIHLRNRLIKYLL